MSQPWPPAEAPDPLPPSDTPESELGSLSPRTALLSPLPEGLELPRQYTRGPSQKFRRQREGAHAATSSRDLLRLLINEEYEARQTRKVLYTVFDRLEQESRRALDAERRIEETVARAKSINEARVAAQQEAARAQEELRLYKLQLDNAQGEISRAQRIVTEVEAQRDDAEAVAAAARSKARRLNEERLIELAREEGRRLGFEEGIRRGRRMGFREGHTIGVDNTREEMDGIAAHTVDRLLAARDELEEESEPRRLPPPRVASPEAHRARTPTLEQRNGPTRGRRSSDSDSQSTMRRMPAPIAIPAGVAPPPGVATSVPSTTSRSSRPASVYGRPTSVRDEVPTVNHVEIHVPPDGYIPTADANFNINLPPPHELQRNILSPSPSQRTLGQPPEQEGIKTRDIAYEPFRPPTHRRASTDSMASTRLSASTISQLGDLVGLPNTGQRRRERDRDRSQGLSVIHEDASMRSERSSIYPPVAGPSQTSLHQGDSYRSDREVDSDATLGRQESHRSRKSSQKLADQLRYSDPTEVEEWRRQGSASKVQSQAFSSTLHRHQHSQLTTPTPLLPPQAPRPTTPQRHGRSQSVSQSHSQGRPDRSAYYSSDSSVPEINVEPPSGPPSDAPSRGTVGGGAAPGLLSPDHANMPLPIPAPAGYTHRPSSPAGLVPTVPNSPVMSNSGVVPGYGQGQLFNVLPDGQFAAGYAPPSMSVGSATSGGSQGPVIPPNLRSGSQRYSPYYPSQQAQPHPGPERDRDRDRRSQHGERERERSSRGRTSSLTYPMSPTPTGVTYPAPPISRDPTLRPSSPSQSTLDERRRSAAGMTPAMRSQTPVGLAPSTQRYSIPPEAVATAGSAGGRYSVPPTEVPGVAGSNPRYGVPGRTSTASSHGSNPRYSVPGRTSSQGSQSRGGYSRYDPQVYIDPAYLSSRESLDAMTDANTAANAGPGRGGRTRPGSPAHGYDRLH